MREKNRDRKKQLLEEIEALEVNLPALLGIYDRPTNQPTDKPTDIQPDGKMDS